MKCIHCGNILADGDLFCGKCGKKQIIDETAGNFGFQTAMGQDTPAAKPKIEPISTKEESPKNSHGFESADDIPKSASPSEREEPRVLPPTPKPVASMTYNRKPLNWKSLGMAAVAIVLVIGCLNAIFDGELFSDSGRSRRKSGRDNYYSYDYYDYDAYDYYNYYDYYDDDFGGYTPQYSSYDCPACTGGRHDLCNGSGIYRNYGQEVECSCDSGRCTICDGSGTIK